eukprot:3009865-Rhodomonas_salina.1
MSFELSTSDVSLRNRRPPKLVSQKEANARSQLTFLNATSQHTHPEARKSSGPETAAVQELLGGALVGEELGVAAQVQRRQRETRRQRCPCAPQHTPSNASVPRTKRTAKKKQAYRGLERRGH